MRSGHPCHYTTMPFIMFISGVKKYLPLLEFELNSCVGVAKKLNFNIFVLWNSCLSIALVNNC